MIPKKAIERAIEGGWKLHELHIGKGAYEDGTFVGFAHWKWKGIRGDIRRATVEQIALDPSFWQSLGRALGWKEHGSEHPSVWYYKALTFYEIILTNGDTEAFWHDLLADQQQGV